MPCSAPGTPGPLNMLNPRAVPLRCKRIRPGPVARSRSIAVSRQSEWITRYVASCINILLLRQRSKFGIWNQVLSKSKSRHSGRWCAHGVMVVADLRGSTRRGKYCVTGVAASNTVFYIGKLKRRTDAFPAIIVFAHHLP